GVAARGPACAPVRARGRERTIRNRRARRHRAGAARRRAVPSWTGNRTTPASSGRRRAGGGLGALRVPQQGTGRMSDSGGFAPAPLASRPLRRLLADVAAITPAPGGGCSAGWTCAFAASLVEMVAGIARERLHPGESDERFAEIAGQARSLRERAIELA